MFYYEVSGIRLRLSAALDTVREDAEIEIVNASDDKDNKPEEEIEEAQPLGDFDRVSGEIVQLNDLAEENEDPVKDHIPDEQALVRRLSNSMAPSAVTNLSSYSQGELQSLDPDLMLESLSDLDQHAHRILKLLAPIEASQSDLDEIIDQLYNPLSKVSRFLQLRSKVLLTTQDIFTSQAYIRPDIVLRSLLGEDNETFPERKWRPDAILYEANLAVLASQLCTMGPDDPTIFATLTSLDGTFPDDFASRVQSDGQANYGSSLLQSETFQIAFELRTQLAIMHMIQETPKNHATATTLLCQVFMDPEKLDDSTTADADLLGVELYTRVWENLPYSSEDLAPKFVERIISLRGPFEQVDHGKKDCMTACREVQQMFPWSRFQRQLLKWTQSRMNELNNDIGRHGGPDAIIVALGREVTRHQTGPDAPSDGEGVEQEASTVEEHVQQPQLQVQPQSTAQVQPQSTAQENTQALLPTGRVAPAVSSRLGKRAHNSESMKLFKKFQKSLGSSAPPAESSGAVALQAATSSASVAPQITASSRSEDPRREPARVGGISDNTPLVDDNDDDYQDVERVLGEASAQQQGDTQTQQPTEEAPKPLVTRALDNMIAKTTREDKENRIEAQRKRAFIDPQPNGDRVEFDEDGATQERERLQLQGPSFKKTQEEPTTSPSKRRRDPSIDDPSEYEGFESDNRQPAAKRVRVEDPARPSARSPSAGPSNRPAQRAVSSNARPPSAGSSTHRTQQAVSVNLATPSVQRASTMPRKNPGQDIEPYIAPPADENGDVPPPTASEQRLLVRAMAKANTRRLLHKPAKQRLPWTAEEEQRLVDCIAEYGAQYSSILKLNQEIFENRNGSLDLRDKARNIKMDYLK